MPPLFLPESGHSGGLWWNEIWQEGLLFNLFQWFIIPAEFTGEKEYINLWEKHKGVLH